MIGNVCFLIVFISLFSIFGYEYCCGGDNNINSIFGTKWYIKKVLTNDDKEAYKIYYKKFLLKHLYYENFGYGSVAFSYSLEEAVRVIEDFKQREKMKCKQSIFNSKQKFERV